MRTDITFDDGTKAKAEAFVGATANSQTMSDFFKGFDYDGEDAIVDDIKKLAYCVSMRYNNEDCKASPAIRLAWQQCNKMCCTVGMLDKTARSIAQDLWHTYFAPRKREERFARFFAEERDPVKWLVACDHIQDTYGLDEWDIEKLRWFVMQVKCRGDFPPSLTRMLYIHGKTKRTGKTTVAKMLTSFLNGDEEWILAYPRYATNLANEMQIGGFKVPIVSSCICAYMDECFYRDMGKTYPDFKKMMTSSGGRARLPYGQEFVWDGRRNYIATSNEPLSTFIKDWDDRRFISIEFKKRPKQLQFDVIAEMWLDFVRHCDFAVNDATGDAMDWHEWADAINPIVEEKGEQTVFAEEYGVIMRSPEFIEKVLGKMPGPSHTCNENHITLKWFVREMYDWGDKQADKHRSEIEAAVVEVFGEKHHGYPWWSLIDLQREAEKINLERYGGGLL